MERAGKVLSFLSKIGENKYLISIRDGLSFTVPFTIIGSIFLIIGNFPIQAWIDFIEPYSGMLGSMVNVTFGMLGLIAAIGVGYSMGKNFGLEPLSNVIITVVAFLLATVGEDYSINPADLDATGMFTAILAAILTTFVTRFVLKRNLVIKMPEGVPPAVTQSFTSLVPALMILSLVWVIKVLLGVDINAFLQLLFKPFIFGLDTIPGLLLYTFLALGLWTFGIHGPNLLSGIATPIFLANFGTNVEAFRNGNPIPHEVAEGFWTLFMNIGGSGATLGLVIAMVFAKSKTYRELGKLSFPSAIFCINEPIIFGFPIVMNPIMAIPFILTPMVLGTATVVLMRLNLIGRIVLQVPWTTPPIIGPYLATNGDVGAAVWSLCTIIISYLIYLPFFRAVDKKQMVLEREERV